MIVIAVYAEKAEMQENNEAKTFNNLQREA